MNKVAILGPDGFLGTELRSYFDKCLINYVGFSRENPFVSDDTKLLMRNQNISDVIYLATSINPLRAEMEKEKVVAELEALKKTLEFLSEFAPTTNFIFPSSGGTIYSNSGRNKLETQPADGANTYGKFKSHCEAMIRSSELSHVILRIANVYGKSQRTGRGQGVIAEWIQSAKLGQKIVVIGSLGQSRDFIYIDDLNRAFASILGTKSLNEAINIGSGSDTSLRELIEIISRTSGNQLIIEQVNGRNFDISNISLNIDKAQKLLGWKPEVEISDGINRIWKNLR